MPAGGARPVEVLDEALRDGIQGVSTVNPRRARKVELLHAMASVGVDVVNLGIPAAGPRQFDDACLLVREIVASRLPLGLTAAARTLAADVEEVARVADRTGASIMVYAFIGSSPIRHFVEGWGLTSWPAASTRPGGRPRRLACPFCLVAEDATRSPPDMLRTLFRAAVDAGAARLCLCDTTGQCHPAGVEALVAFARRELGALGAAGIELRLARPQRSRARPRGRALGGGERRRAGPRHGARRRGADGQHLPELLVDNLGRLGARPRCRASAWPRTARPRRARSPGPSRRTIRSRGRSPAGGDAAPADARQGGADDGRSGRDGVYELLTRPAARSRRGPTLTRSRACRADGPRRRGRSLAGGRRRLPRWRGDLPRSPAGAASA